MQAVIQIEDVTKIYQVVRRQAITALKEIRFSVQRGELIGVVGPNAAGKTTLIKCILGLVEPTSGRIEIMGSKAYSRDALASIAAVLEGSRNIFWRLTARENLEYFTRLHGLSAKRLCPVIERLIETFGLEPHVLKEARMLSKGFQQRLATACALVKQTPIVILDEPTVGLDIESSLNIRTSLRLLAREEGRTVLVTSHEMEMIETVCDRVIILDHGQLVVDETIKKLKQMFRATSFVCDFHPPNGDPTMVEKELRNLGVLRSLERIGKMWRAELDIANPMSLEDVMDCLRQTKCMIEMIGRQHTDLKDIFLRVTKPRKKGDTDDDARDEERKH